MNKLITILLFVPLFSFAQPGQDKYFVKFTDKNNSTFSLDNPSEYLSQRAMNRRAAQNIPIDVKDLPVNIDYISQVVSKGASILTKSKWLNGITISCDANAISSIQLLPFVESAKKVFIRSNFSPVNKVLESPQARLTSPLRIASFDYGGSFNQIHIMNGEYLHEDGYTGEGKLIAILDAGFYSVDQLPAFENIRNLNKIITTWDFVEGNTSVYEDDTHGMMVLSTIAGNLPGELVGTAPDASFLLLRTEDVFSENIIEEYNWEAGAEFADSAGADVISSSLGYTEFDDPTSNHVYADMDGDHCPSTIAADIAVSKGILVLVSAGNSGNSSWHYIGAPSDGDSVLSIGGVTADGYHVGFSSWGPASDLAVKPNVCAQGLFCTVADENGGVTNASGTSFSCPILAGSAACLWQEFPSLTPIQIKEAIERSANYYVAPNDTLGYGIPDFRLAGYLLSTGKLPSQDDVLGVYPNPFSENLNVSFFSTSFQNVKIEMINTVGQIVSEQFEVASAWSVNTFTISNNSNLNSGFYFVKVSTTEGNIVSRVFKY